MTDIFREIEEDLRRDRYTQIVRRVAPLLIAVVVLIIVSVSGWQIWRWQQKQMAEEAGARFEEALQIARDGEILEAEQALKTLAEEGPEGYQLLSRLRLAGLMSVKDPEAGIAAFHEIAKDPKVDPIWRELAQLRAILLQVNKISLEEAQEMLQPLTSPGGAWRLSALETLGLLALQAGKLDDASRWFDQILADPRAPVGLRRRVQEVYLSLIAGGPVKVSKAP